MELSELTAISPADGRYRYKTQELAQFFSEYALIKYRMMVEVEYFIALGGLGLPQLKKFTAREQEKLRAIYLDFTVADASVIKQIERKTNHDVKAVEYFIKQKLVKLKLGNYKEFVHFALTSQDINNTALPLMVCDAYTMVLEPEMDGIILALNKMANEWKEIPMLARTHGQPASPTRVGKELFVFVERLENQLLMVDSIPWMAKFGGATGNFNAHHAAFPKTDWITFADDFICKLGLNRQRTTTQVEHYDELAAFLDGLKRVNIILTDLCRDMWLYISMDYFRQKIKKGEIGSSTMPHKVNPLDFENAEGNLGFANALLTHLSAKLPVSRLQRDLTDSTVSRNIGLAFAHMLIALKSLSKGLGKLLINKAAIEMDLDKNWAVISEAIQTILRREGYPEPYEALKDLTRNSNLVTKSTLHSFIDKLKVKPSLKKELKAITPAGYTGICPF